VSTVSSIIAKIRLPVVVIHNMHTLPLSPLIKMASSVSVTFRAYDVIIRSDVNVR